MKTTYLSDDTWDALRNEIGTTLMQARGQCSGHDLEVALQDASELLAAHRVMPEVCREDDELAQAA